MGFVNLIFFLVVRVSKLVFAYFADKGRRSRAASPTNSAWKPTAVALNQTKFRRGLCTET